MKEKFEIAKNAILEGSKNEFISKITGLTVEQVEQLRNPKEA
jgi:ribosomal protein L10